MVIKLLPNTPVSIFYFQGPLQSWNARGDGCCLEYMEEVVSTAVLSNTTMQGLPATPADNNAITEVLETALGSMTLREVSTVNVHIDILVINVYTILGTNGNTCV